jgi:hypothetical protein
VAQGSSEFECLAGAQLEPNLAAVAGDPTRQDDAGRTINVTTYDGSKLTVFGFTPSYVERLSDTTGWSGVGVYLETRAAAVRQRIGERFPAARDVADGVVQADGLTHPIRIQDATGGSVYLQCAPLR